MEEDKQVSKQIKLLSPPYIIPENNLFYISILTLMALPPSTANWHWKNKNITQWGKEWFERELTTLSVTGDNEKEVVSVSKVTDVDGDIELGQRKSK